MKKQYTYKHIYVDGEQVYSECYTDSTLSVIRWYMHFDYTSSCLELDENIFVILMDENDNELSRVRLIDYIMK